MVKQHFVNDHSVAELKHDVEHASNIDLFKNKAELASPASGWSGNRRNNAEETTTAHLGPFNSPPIMSRQVTGPPEAPYPMTDSVFAPFEGPRTCIYNTGAHLNGWLLHIPRYLSTDEFITASSNLRVATNAPSKWADQHDPDCTRCVKHSAPAHAALMKVLDQQHRDMIFLEYVVRLNFAALDGEQDGFIPIWEKQSSTPQTPPTPSSSGSEPLLPSFPLPSLDVVAELITHQTDKDEDQLALAHAELSKVQHPLDHSGSVILIAEQDGILKRSEQMTCATVFRHGSELIFEGPLGGINIISDMDDTDNVDDTGDVENEDTDSNPVSPRNKSPSDTDELRKADEAEFTMIVHQSLLSRVLAHTKPKLAFTVFICSIISFFLGCRFTELQAVRVQLPKSDIVVNAFFPHQESKILPAVIVGLGFGVIAELLYHGVTVAWGEQGQDAD
jgi:hypothetical protein